MHESLQGATFHVEHGIPRARGGKTISQNLAWACPACNLGKSDRMEAPDPETGHVVSLFSPRKDVWSEHFRWEGYEITPRTPIGRATVALLDLNRARRVLIRRAEELFGLFPPRV
jgi:hypothetical protein